ncbi:MAG TPA: hypothetical protein PL029_08900 [Bacteroidia bacterium]|nr:hypothetical protein [Bacteroidia bacterium]
MNFKETEKFKVRVVDNAYYIVEVKDDAEFDRDDLLLLVQYEKDICNRQLPVLVLCAPTAGSSSEFVKYLSKNENNPLSLADAFVLSSISQKILAHFYKLFGSHERPISFFNTQDEAMIWLKQFLK